jgi:tetratricopeptide (TPR) repeat protein
VEEALAACLRVTESGVCHEAASWFYWTLGRFEIDQGRDARADLDRAAELLAGARERKLDNLAVRTSAAWLELQGARQAVRDARDGRGDAGAVQAASAALARGLAACYQLDAKHATCVGAEAEGALLFARTRADLVRARAAAAAALELHPRDADVLLLLADADLRLGNTDVARATCARALAIDPALPALARTCGPLDGGAPPGPTSPPYKRKPPAKPATD